MQSNHLLKDRLNEIHKWLTPKNNGTETERKVFYEETEEIVRLKHLDGLSSQIKLIWKAVSSVALPPTSCNWRCGGLRKPPNVSVYD